MKSVRGKSDMHSRSPSARLMGTILVLMMIDGWVLGFSISSNQIVQGGLLAGEGAGNSITPSAVAGGYLYSWAGVSTPGLDMGPYLITNNNGSNLVFNLNGGSINGTGIVGVITFRGVISGPSPSAGIVITNAGAVAMGGIDTHGQRLGADWQNPNNAGSVTLGSVASPVGPVRMDMIDAHAGALADGNGIGGHVSVYSSGDVKIESSVGVAGDIRTWVWSQYAGNVNVVHEGSFRVSNILTYLVSSWTGGTMHSGSINCNGDALGDGSSGAFECASLQTYYGGGGWGSSSGAITIRGYTGVLINGDIRTYEKSANQTWLPGNVLITNITGDITLKGGVDLSGTGNAGGDLKLFAGGIIRVKDLDLNLLNKVAFSAGRHKSYILGVVTNFAGDNDPRLLAPTGDKVYYDARFSPALSNAIYRLRDLGGNTGGGLLEPIPARGTVVVFR